MQQLETIQKRRKNLNLTQSQLAKLADVSQSVIAKIESKRINPSFKIAKMIFDALDSIETQKSIKARDIMTRKVITVKASDKIEHAIKIMRNHEISQLPVFKNGSVVGLICESDLIAHYNDVRISSKKIESIMEDAPPLISEETPINSVSELLKYHPILIVTKKAKLAGVVAKADLLKTVK